jgi:hypothetical protein
MSGIIIRAESLSNRDWPDFLASFLEILRHFQRHREPRPAYIMGLPFVRLFDWARKKAIASLVATPRARTRFS